MGEMGFNQFKYYFNEGHDRMSEIYKTEISRVLDVNRYH